mgnify:CR=1 FL=1
MASTPQVTNNIIRDIEGAGFGIWGCYNCLFAHNTLVRVGPRSHLLEVSEGGIHTCCAAHPRCAQTTPPRHTWAAIRTAPQPTLNRVFVAALFGEGLARRALMRRRRGAARALRGPARAGWLGAYRHRRRGALRVGVGVGGWGGGGVGAACWSSTHVCVTCVEATSILQRVAILPRPAHPPQVVNVPNKLVYILNNLIFNPTAWGLSQVAHGQGRMRWVRRHLSVGRAGGTHAAGDEWRSITYVYNKGRSQTATHPRSRLWSLPRPWPPAPVPCSGSTWKLLRACPPTTPTCPASSKQTATSS